MLRSFCLFLALSGAVLSAWLLAAHVQHGATSDQAATMPLALCGSGGNCDKVLESRWAWFPPLPIDASATEGVEPETVRSKSKASGAGVRVPVALLGLFYYTLLVMWFALFGRESRAVESRLVVPLCIVGSVASASFIALMGFAIGVFCPLCMASHGVNFLLLALILIRWRSLRAGASNRSSDAGGARDRLEWNLASLRTAAVPVALLMAVWAVEALAYHSAGLELSKRAMAATLNELQQDVDAIELVYFGQPKQNVTVRDDSRSGLDALEFDAAISASDGYRNTVVVFGDVECGACRRFHEFLMESVLPAYEGHLRVVYKHLPYDAGHPNARRAALALEAARRQGKFWEFLDLLYAEQGALRGFDYGAAVSRLGMDLTSFVRDMSSADVAARIAEDEALARELEVTATPAVFLNNRRVDKSLVRLPGFWNSQIERLKNSRAEAGQGWGIEPDAAEAVASSR